MNEKNSTYHHSSAKPVSNERRDNRGEYVGGGSCWPGRRTGGGSIGSLYSGGGMLPNVEVASKSPTGSSSRSLRVCMKYGGRTCLMMRWARISGGIGVGDRGRKLKIKKSGRGVGARRNRIQVRRRRRPLRRSWAPPKRKTRRTSMPMAKARADCILEVWSWEDKKNRVRVILDWKHVIFQF